MDVSPDDPNDEPVKDDGIELAHRSAELAAEWREAAAHLEILRVRLHNEAETARRTARLLRRIYLAAAAVTVITATFATVNQLTKEQTNPVDWFIIAVSVTIAVGFSAYGVASAKPRKHLDQKKALRAQVEAKIASRGLAKEEAASVTSTDV